MSLLQAIYFALIPGSGRIRGGGGGPAGCKHEEEEVDEVEEDGTVVTYLDTRMCKCECEQKCKEFCGRMYRLSSSKPDKDKDDKRRGYGDDLYGGYGDDLYGGYGDES